MTIHIGLLTFVARGIHRVDLLFDDELIKSMPLVIQVDDAYELIASSEPLEETTDQG